MVAKKGKILVVDDEPANVRLLERILQLAGYTQVMSTTDPRTVPALFEQFQPDLILTDLFMPFLDGFALMQELRKSPEAHGYLPIVVLTADVTSESKRRALASGATDFLTKPFDHSEVLLRVGNLLQTRFLHVELQGQNAVLEANVRIRTHELEEALRQLKEAQDQMLQQERVRALGMLAGGIAHDFNNSLASILGYSELLLRDASTLSLAPKVTDYLQIVVTAAKDATRMISRLRDFSRPRSEQETRVAVDLRELVEQTVSLTLPRWQTEAQRRGVTIKIKVEAGDVPRIGGDPAELREVLTNLIFNAVDAMPDGGTVTFSILGRQEAVELAIQDTGTGMSEETRQRCLEPFFTTKGNRGTGLGLAMVHGIIQRHDGSLEIKSAIGEGTRFILRFPIGKSMTVQAPEATATVGRSLRVLVVDDQPLICQLLQQYLSRDAHVVELASDGCQAWEKFQQGIFDLVLTDKAMPGMDGDQLAARIKQLKPSQPIILLTGFGDLAYPEGECPKSIDLILSKPVAPEALRHAVAQLMAA
jgi:signal transduction histidine kinase